MPTKLVCVCLNMFFFSIGLFIIICSVFPSYKIIMCNTLIIRKWFLIIIPLHLQYHCFHFTCTDVNTVILTVNKILSFHVI